MYRSGSFPLLQLLIEIQYKIFGFVLQPIYQHYTNTATPYINIRVGAFLHTFGEDYAGGYDQYCAARVGWEAYLDEVYRTPEDGPGRNGAGHCQIRKSKMAQRSPTQEASVSYADLPKVIGQ
jgi:hypothetical protein